MTLVEFLNARLTEDEQVARAATPGPWWWDRTERDDWGAQGPTLESKVKPDESVIQGWGHDAWGLYVEDPDAAHIARHDPARVLRDVEAKRAIVEKYAALDANPERLNDVALHLQHGVLRDVVETLAATYAEHPDY